MVAGGLGHSQSLRRLIAAWKGGVGPPISRQVRQLLHSMCLLSCCVQRRGHADEGHDVVGRARRRSLHSRNPAARLIKH